MINLNLFQITVNRDEYYNALAEVSAHNNVTTCPICKCRKCELMELVSPRLCVTYAQKKWPDYLSCMQVDIVSERVVNDLVDNKITGFQVVKLEFYSVKPASKPASMQYYYLKATGQAVFNPVLPFDVPNVPCLVCGCWDPKYTLPNSVEVGYYPLQITKWDGLDIVNGFYTKSFRTFCSRKVIELARNKKWTNFGFTIPYTVSAQVNHLKTNWEELLLQGLKKDFQGRLDKFPQFNLPMPDFLLNVNVD